MATFRHVNDAKRILEVPDSDASRIRILESSARYTRIDKPTRPPKVVKEDGDAPKADKPKAAPKADKPKADEDGA